MSTLAEALTNEHKAIDAGIGAFTAALAGGSPPVATMREALAAHRRHIYLEETLLFPQLRSGGLFASIMVMLREHGQMWQQMDEIDAMLDAGGTDPHLRDLCEMFVALIDAHNLKEEATVYAQADAALNAPASATLREFLASGTLPEGWVCDKAR